MLYMWLTRSQNIIVIGKKWAYTSSSEDGALHMIQKNQGIIVKDFSNLIYIIAFATGWYICHYTHIG